MTAGSSPVNTKVLAPPEMNTYDHIVLYIARLP